jgi:hypothetical protein
VRRGLPVRPMTRRDAEPGDVVRGLTSNTSAKTRGKASFVAPGFGQLRVDVVHEVCVP